MEYRKLGRTGLDVSEIGLGTEHLEQSTDNRIHESMLGHCTYCNHCLPCPQNIDIGFTYSSDLPSCS